MAALATTKALAGLPSIDILPHGIADPDIDVQFSVPVFDFAALTAGSPEERSKLLSDLGEICQTWGFFILTNHGVPESLTKEMMEACDRFFRLPEEKKKRLQTSDILDPIKYGSNFGQGGKLQLWREFVQMRTYPDFHSLDEPVGFSEVAKEFGRRVREVTEGLIKAISESLGLESDCIHKALELDEAVQMIASNWYPPHAQPDQAVGLFAHTDVGLLTLLLENSISGLQIAYNGKWVKAGHAKVPNSFYVIVADHLQILTNGKYKSVIHRATVNDKATRISITIPYGPPYEKAITPLPELLKKEGESSLYEAMNYTEYMKLKREG